MTSERMAALLAPFLETAVLSPQLLDSLVRYVELLLRWNARMNLTAIRDPEEIVNRHFGESLFAARVLQKAGAFEPASAADPSVTLADIGSGAGFPGIPIKLFAPRTKLILIESQSKKATFLREVLRALDIAGAAVFQGRAQAWDHKAQIVTLRAVERFESVLPVAAARVAPEGRLCLLIGSRQVANARRALGPGEGWLWDSPQSTPGSGERVVMVGKVADWLPKI